LTVAFADTRLLVIRLTSVDSAEIRQLAAVEDHHWWYRERRAILARELRRLPSRGLVLDIGAAAGGNTAVLRKHGWQAVAVDYSEAAVAIGKTRGVAAIRADARRLPARSAAFDLVTALDVLEHVEEDYLLAGEIRRTLRPGGTALIAVPCDMTLWSAHDDAVGHFRRYSRETLTSLIDKAGLSVDSIWSWNVLLQPVVKLRRRSVTKSDLDEVPPLLNRLLTSVIVAERYLPTKSLPGVTLFLRAHRKR
jgi:SAM-dependent methyltransferase